MRRNFLVLGSVAVLFLSSAAAAAEPASTPPAAEAPPTADSHARTGFGVMLGAKAGAILPFGGLSPWAQFGAEVGVVFPWLKRGIGLALHVDYSQPTSNGTQAGDPRIDGGTYNWHITQQYLTFMPVLMYRMTNFKAVTPYIGAGPRIYLMKSTVSGSVGAIGIPETTEQSTAIGFGVPLGVEINLGPGGLIVELLGQWGPYDHDATGPTHTGALSLSAGYRFVL